MRPNPIRYSSPACVASVLDVVVAARASILSAARPPACVATVLNAAIAAARGLVDSEHCCSNRL